MSGYTPSPGYGGHAQQHGQSYNYQSQPSHGGYGSSAPGGGGSASSYYDSPHHGGGSSYNHNGSSPYPHPGGSEVGPDGERGMGTMAMGAALGFGANKMGNKNSHKKGGGLKSALLGAATAQGAKMLFDHVNKPKPGHQQHGSPYGTGYGHDNKHGKHSSGGGLGALGGLAGGLMGKRDAPGPEHSYGSPQPGYGSPSPYGAPPAPHYGGGGHHHQSGGGGHHHQSSGGGGFFGKRDVL